MAKRKRPVQSDRPLVERDSRAVQRDREMADAVRGVTDAKFARGPAARGRARSIFS